MVAASLRNCLFSCHLFAKPLYLVELQTVNLKKNIKAKVFYPNLTTKDSFTKAFSSDFWKLYSSFFLGYQ